MTGLARYRVGYLNFYCMLRDMSNNNAFEQHFPVEVRELFRQGIPPATFYSGPLIAEDALTPEFTAMAINKLAEARKSATEAPGLDSDIFG